MNKFPLDWTTGLDWTGLLYLAPATAIEKCRLLQMEYSDFNKAELGDPME